MQAMSSHSSSFASGDHHITTAGSSLASTHRAEPAHLHDVDIYIWEISYQSAIVTHIDLPAPFVASTSSPSTTDSGTPSQPQQPHQKPIEDTDQHRSVSPTTPVTIDSRLSTSPPREILPAHNQGARRALCPKCRAYTSKRSFNIKRHQKSCHKKAPGGQAKGKESLRSTGSGMTLF